MAKYNKKFNNEQMMKIMAIFMDSKESLTVADISTRLGGQLTSQKIVRLIGDVNEVTPIIRQKSNGLTHYKMKSVHEEQGYDVSFYTGPNNSANYQPPEPTFFEPGERGWVAPMYRHLYDEEGNEK